MTGARTAPAPLAEVARRAGAAAYNPAVIKPPGSPMTTVGAIAPSAPVDTTAQGRSSRWFIAVQPLPANGPPSALGETVTARLLQPPNGGAVAVDLSDAARSLSALLQAADLALPSTPPSALSDALRLAAQGPVLMGHPSDPPAARAQQLARAVVHSGLFYESHLQAWAEGRLPLDAVRSEPQARLAQALADHAPASQGDAAAPLGSLLQRQLDALDGKPLFIAGSAWPGQPVELRLKREAQDAPQPDARSLPDADPPAAPAGAAWSTELRLTLPQLGALSAHVRLNGLQLSVEMDAADDVSVALLAEHRSRLATALQSCGLTLAELSVRTQAQDHAPTQAPG